MLARLESNYAQKVQGVGLIRGDREDLLIDMVGSVKTPRLMVPDGNC